MSASPRGASGAACRLRTDLLTYLPRAATLALLIALACGCSNYAPPHIPHSPMLESGGELELSGSISAQNDTQPTFAARLALAPADGFVIVAGADFDAISEGSTRTQHVAGELAAGAFLTGFENLRGELLLGVAGGYASGRWNGEEVDDEVDGAYARPFAQGALGGRWDWFVWGGGLRIATTIADLTLTPYDPSLRRADSGVYAQIHFDPFTYAGVRFDGFEVDLLFGGSFSEGHPSVGGQLRGYLALTLRSRFELWSEGPTPPQRPSP